MRLWSSSYSALSVVDRIEAQAPSAIAEALVRSLDPGPTWTVDTFVVAESIARNRPIRVVVADHAAPLASGISGQLWPFDSHDEIVLAAGLSAAERRYVIAHEMGHLLLDHPRRASNSQWVNWFGALPPGLVMAHIGAFSCNVGPRTANDDPAPTDSERAEQEAEWFASILLAVVDEKRGRIAINRGRERGAVMIDRLARTFGYY
ncbi:MAG: ImmA/IrrE family metallo-endopeptidase [Thermoleophilaceae bacterium]|nr:ImmA/IrrE family metallo-endopeptidase [Thermoleophilaceae bacterium]